MATVNLEGYDSTTGKKVPVNTSDTINISLPSSALEVPVFTGNLVDQNTVEQALTYLDTATLSSNNTVTNNTVSIMDHFITGSGTGATLWTDKLVYQYTFGVGASANLASNDTQPCFGVIKLSTSANINTTCLVRTFVGDVVPANIIYITPNLVVELEFRFRLSNVASTSMKLGLITTNQYNTTPLMGLYYDSSSGANFMSHLSDTLTRYSVDTSVAADTSWHKFRLVYTKSTNTADYYLDDSLITSQNTSAWVIAEDSLAVGMGIKNLTASGRILSMDWLKATIDSGLGL